jgi:hypothetical protein
MVGTDHATLSAHSQLEDHECIAAIYRCLSASRIHSMQFVNRSNGLKVFVPFLAAFIALSDSPVRAWRGQEDR